MINIILFNFEGEEENFLSIVQNYLPRDEEFKIIINSDVKNIEKFVSKATNAIFIPNIINKKHLKESTKIIKAARKIQHSGSFKIYSSFLLGGDQNEKTLRSFGCLDWFNDETKMTAIITKLDMFIGKLTSTLKESNLKNVTNFPPPKKNEPKKEKKINLEVESIFSDFFSEDAKDIVPEPVEQPESENEVYYSENADLESSASLAPANIKVEITYDKNLKEETLNCEFEDIYENELVVLGNKLAFSVGELVIVKVELNFAGKKQLIQSEGKVIELEPHSQDSEIITFDLTSDLKDKFGNFFELLQSKQDNITNFLNCVRGY